MKIAGGAASVQAQALEFGITPAEVAQAARGAPSAVGCAASALAGRGRPNPNKGPGGNNPDAVRLGMEISVAVMGQLQWDKYTTTSAKAMAREDKPHPVSKNDVSKNASTGRPSREGWVFHGVIRTTKRWTMMDKITFTLPNHTKETPVLYVNAISEAYHLNWNRHSDRKRRTRMPASRCPARTRRTRMLARRSILVPRGHRVFLKYVVLVCYAESTFSPRNPEFSGKQRGVSSKAAARNSKSVAIFTEFC